MKCESCNHEHDGTYGSGRFCDSKCARSFSTKSKRLELNERVSKTMTGRLSSLKGKPGKLHSQEEKQKISDGLKKHYKNNPQKTLSSEERKKKNVASVIAYRARKRKAIPEDADLHLIQRIYDSCPIGYHVDHIVALAAGGMHHQDNLQYLPITENCRKGKSNNYDATLAIKWQSLLSFTHNQVPGSSPGA